MERETHLRVRSALSTWGWLLAVLLLAGVAIGGWGAYTAFNPGTTQEVTEHEVWDIETAFSHEATVTEANPVFPNGSVLRNRSTYLTAVSPIVEGTYRATYRSRTDQPLDVRIERSMVIRAEGEEEVYWTERAPAGPPVQATLQPGESTTATVSINATAFDQRRDAILESIGATPGETTLAVVFSVSATGSVEGAPTRVSFTDRVPVSVQADSYQVEQGVGTEEPVTRQTVTEVPVEHGPLLRIGGPLLALLSLGGLLALSVAAWQNTLSLSEPERRELEYRTQRSEFDEWIVTTAVPDSIAEREAAEAETVTDVVDFAIDSDVAAIEDVKTGAIYAIGTDVSVVYHPPRVGPADGTREVGALDRLRTRFEELLGDW